MTIRRPLPYLLALSLGVAAALLVACGTGTKGGIPAADAGDLKSQIEDVQQAVEDGRCTDVSGQLRQVDSGIDDLPGTVDEGLQQRLRDASDGLHRLAVSECNERKTQTTDTTTTETPPETTTTPPTQTQTAPPETTTTPPETTTTPPTTVAPPVPPPVVPPASPPVAPPVPPPAEPPVPPPAGTPGGGASPEVGPP